MRVYDTCIQNRDRKRDAIAYTDVERSHKNKSEKKKQRIRVIYPQKLTTGTRH